MSGGTAYVLECLLGGILQNEQKARKRLYRSDLFKLSVFFLVAAGIAHAQAGPPIRTDDPDTPGNKHWEINFGWLAPTQFPISMSSTEA